MTQHTDPMLPEYAEIHQLLLLFHRCNQDGHNQELQFWNSSDEGELL
jgi:hypothetical protein